MSAHLSDVDTLKCSRCGHGHLLHWPNAVDRKTTACVACLDSQDGTEIVCDRTGYHVLEEGWRDLSAARVAAAVAAEREAHHARTAEHIDMHAVKQIIDVTGCDGEQGVAAWHALQPLVGHIEREAIVKARAAEREAWVEALATCPCGCDVSLHFNVCSTADCDCDRNEYNARYVAAESALIAEARS